MLTSLVVIKLASNLALLKEGSTKDQDNSSKQVMQLNDRNRKANHQHDTLKPEPSSFTFFQGSDIPHILQMSDSWNLITLLFVMVLSTSLHFTRPSPSSTLEVVSSFMGWMANIKITTTNNTEQFIYHVSRKAAKNPQFLHFPFGQSCHYD